MWHITYIMKNLAGIGKKSRSDLSMVLEKHAGPITPKIVAETLNISTQESGRLLSRWNKSGWMHRVKRGVYIPASLSSTSITPVIEEPFLIADAIYGPGYIGGFSAVKHWDLSEQIIETVTYYTRKMVRIRHPTHGGVKFKLKTIAEHKHFGLKPIWIGSHKIYVSDPTKTIVDIFDDPKVVGGMAIVQDIFGEYFESEYYDFELLVQYVHKINNKSIFKRLGFLLDTCFPIGQAELSLLRENISEGYSIFDPSTTPKQTISKWRLKTSRSWKALYDRKK